jgi:7-carboxy-7-deazaguanine synthase
MSLSISIQGTKEFVYEDNSLVISELFYDTIQGEGIHTGVPAVFIRLAGCTLSCSFCDSKNTWNEGKRLGYTELLELMRTFGIVDRLRAGHHLVITGGSPLKQQQSIICFLEAFFAAHQFRPFVEMENECVIVPTVRMLRYVDCWNNSPKLSSSGNPVADRYKPDTIRFLNMCAVDSWYKFVIGSEADWKEVDEYFIRTGLVGKERIILMPMASSREELHMKQEEVVKLAVRNGVRYGTRLHVELWNTRRCV